MSDTTGGRRPNDGSDRTRGGHQRGGEDPAELARLHEEARLLDEEVASLRRKVADGPKRVRTLEERLLETKGQLAQAVAQNEKLSYTLREAREHIAALRDEVDKLTRPPSAYGVVVGKNDDGTIDVLSSGRKMRVNMHPDIEVDELDRGAEVALNESFNIILARAPERSGEVVSVKEVMEDGVRALIVGRADEERVCELADAIRGIHLRPGDTLLMDSRTGMLLEKLPRPEVEDLLLEEVPGHQLQRRRRPRRADRGDRRRRRAALPPPGAVRRAPPSALRRASCSTARPAAARRSSPRPWPTAWPRRWPRRQGTPRGAATSSTSRAPSCSTSTSARPNARSASCSSGRGRRAKRAGRSSCSSTRWTRCSAPAGRASPRTWSRPSSRSCWPRSTASKGSATSS